MLKSKFSTMTLLLGLSLSMVGCGLNPGSSLNPQASSHMQSLELGLQATPTKSLRVPARPTVAPNPWQDNNSATLHIGPTENVAAVEDLIKNAKNTLFIEVFSFANDSFGQRVTAHVIAAAKRGVKVKFLCDYAASRFIGGKKLGDEMEKAGVDFRMWEPRFIMQNDKKRGINIDHRKLYLADGSRGLAGGVNLKAPFDSTTHDLLVDFQGDEAAQLHREFSHDWVNADGDPVTWAPLPANVKYGTVRATTLVTSPVEGRFEAQAAIYQALESAKSEIQIEQQYLWDKGLMERLTEACKRGVSVRVIVPGKSDNKVFKHLHAVSMNELLTAGGQVHLYNGSPVTAHVHTKFFCVDGAWAVFGSVNGDTRALIDNQELDVATTDAGLVKELQTRLFEEDWQSSSVVYRFEESEWYEESFGKLWDILHYYM